MRRLILVSLLLAGCATRRETVTVVTRSCVYERTVTSTVIGGGNRSVLINADGTLAKHSEIPETLDAAGRLAGEVAKGAVQGAKPGL